VPAETAGEDFGDSLRSAIRGEQELIYVGRVDASG
jgi:hypothetical protein